MSFARNQRRQAGRMSAAEERLQEADRNFFKQHPHRNHLVRLAAPCEIAGSSEAIGATISMRPGYRLFAIIRQVHPGARLRAYRQNAADTPVDLTEEEAAQVYDLAASDWHRETEAKILMALRKGSTVH